MGRALGLLPARPAVLPARVVCRRTTAVISSPSPATPHARGAVVVRSSKEETEGAQREATPDVAPPSGDEIKRRKAPKRQADSTDAVASFLTRRFGIAGGLAWLGILTFGVVSEQVKTRLEVASEERNVREVTDLKEITTASGLKYTDLKIGGGSSPYRGCLTVVDFKISVDGETLYDTKRKGRPYVFPYGARPFTGGVCKGVEEGLATMKAGGRRLMTVPPESGFGSSKAILNDDTIIPPNSILSYDVELLRISIPPS